MTDAGRDTKLYPLCDPWHGERGPKFTRKFAPDFLSGLAKPANCDKFSSMRNHLFGLDVGGVPPTYMLNTRECECEYVYSVLFHAQK